MTRGRLIRSAHIKNTGCQIRWCFMSHLHSGSALLLYVQCVALIAVQSAAAGAGMSRRMSAFCSAISSHIRCGDDSRTRFRSGESTIMITPVEYTSNPPLMPQNPKVQHRKYKRLEPIPSTSRPVTYFLDEKAQLR